MAANAASRFEDETCNYLLARFEMPQVKWEMLREHEAATGEKRLLLAPFCCQFFPDFPYYLASRVIKKASEISLATLLLKFEKTPLLDAYDLLSTESFDASTRPVGLIFRCRGFAHGLILHNGMTSQAPGARLEWSHPDGSLLTLEPFSQFVTRLAWKPQRG